jgi:DNA-binding transcriptional ArsR family regulator
MNPFIALADPPRLKIFELIARGETSVGAIERGRRWARLTTLHKLAKGLGVSTDELSFSKV